MAASVAAFVVAFVVGGTMALESPLHGSSSVELVAPQVVDGYAHVEALLLLEEALFLLKVTEGPASFVLLAL